MDDIFRVSEGKLTHSSLMGSSETKSLLNPFIVKVAQTLRRLNKNKLWGVGSDTLCFG